MAKQKSCSIENCHNKVQARNWCSKHYSRWKKTGDVHNYGSCVVGDPKERFYSKIKLEQGCWLWTGKKTSGNYGQFWDGSKYVMAHRWSYSHHVGEIVDDLTIDHLCHSWDASCLGGDNCRHRSCVNPNHLEPVTICVNILRGNTIAKLNLDKKICSNGHLFNEENTYMQGNRRKCRICRSQVNRAYYMKRKSLLEFADV